MTSEELERARLEALSRYDVLDGPPAPELQALVEIAATACDVPRAAINLITGDTQHQIAASGFEPSVCSRKDSMCAAVLTEPEPVVVPDATRDPRFSDNPFVTGVIGDTRFYASAPLVTPDGQYLGRLCVFDSRPREMSERRRESLAALAARVVDVLELRLRTRMLERSLLNLSAMRDELNRSNERLSRFAGQVSHDLLNPLTAIIASAEVLEEEPALLEDAGALALTDNILACGRRMEGLVREFLRDARIGSRAARAEVDLAEVAAAVVSDLQVLVRKAGATIDVGPLPVVSGDAAQLYAVLLNLVTNALKFTRPGVAPLVRVSSEPVDGAWRVTVADNGPGIPPEARERVFQMFARADPAVEGSGIGLSTALRFVEEHGGSMGIGDSADGGAAVWFRLPVAGHAPEPGHPRAASARAPSRGAG